MSDVITVGNPLECTPAMVFLVISTIFILINLLISFIKYNVWSTMSSLICNCISSCICLLILLSLCTITVGSLVGWVIVALYVLCIICFTFASIAGYTGIPVGEKDD